MVAGQRVAVERARAGEAVGDAVLQQLLVALDARFHYTPIVLRNYEHFETVVLLESVLPADTFRRIWVLVHPGTTYEDAK